MKRIYFLLLTVLFAAATTNAQVANYSFAASSGTYTTLVAPTNVYTGLWDDNTAVSVPLGFTFTFNAVGYTTAFVHPNGYISFGASTSGYVPISNTGVYAGAVAGWGHDIQAQPAAPAGSVDYLSSGGVFTVQWTNARRYDAAVVQAERINFQIKLIQATNEIVIVYGSWTDAILLGASGDNATVGGQVGLRGTSNADFKNLSVLAAGSWAAPTAGAINTASCYYNSITPATKPASGQTYTFTPPPPCVAPANSASGLVLTAISTSQINGSFTAAPADGYLTVRYSTGATPVNPVNGTTYLAGTSLGTGQVVQASAATTFSATGLTPSTTYDFYVYPYNNVGCSGGPTYKTSSPATGTQTTNACGGLAAGTYTVGPTGTYLSLTAAIAATAAGTTGPVIFELQSTYLSAVETFPVTIPANPCITSLVIRPAVGAAGLSITSANATATIDYNGGTNVTFDGRPGGVGATSQLSIINTNTTGVAIRFINDASNNTITYCDVQGQNTSNTSSTASNSGVIYFGGTSTAALLGNDNNTISFCNVHGAGASFPAIGISAIGNVATTVSYNDNNTINNCNIYDYFIATTASTGIKTDAGNSAWTITNNSLYQTASRTYTTAATHRGFWITPNTANLTPQASGFVITGNYIGGSAANAGGTAYTMLGSIANVFNGMDISVGLGTATSVQNNTVANIALTTTSAANPNFAGISIANGHVNIGTVTGNTIGSGTGTGSITINQTTTGGGTVYGIRLSGGTSTTMAANNNTVGSFTINGSAATISDNFIGIGAVGGTTTVITINGNTVGSTSTASSINQTTAGASNVSLTGIAVTSGPTGATSISNNTIANMNSNCTSTGVVKGINATVGILTVNGNTIRDLSSQTISTGTGSGCGIVGISITSTSAGHSISGNKVHSLVLTSVSTTLAIQITGLFYSGTTTGTNTISKNLIHSFDVTAVNPAATITGIDIGGGTSMFANNMIRLGINAAGTSITTALTVRGITIGTTSTNNINFNSIYLGGTGVGTNANNSFAFNRSATSGTLDVRDNIFVNNRSNATTGGIHYAVKLAASTTVFPTLDYNVYQYTGTGGKFGNNGAVDFAAYTAGWIAGDLNSGAANPQYLNPTGTSATVDLHIHPSNPTPVEGAGINIAAVTDDYDAQARAGLTPVDIGADAGNFVYGDLVPPAISYTTLGNTSCFTDRILSPVTITDLSGVNIAAGTRPRLYYRKTTNANTFNDNTSATDGWKYVEATGVGGSPFSFTMNYSLLNGGAPVLGTIMEYFVVAQDLAVTPNVSINAGSFTVQPANVALTAAAFPVNGAGSYTFVATGLSGTKTIGATGDYTTISGAAGLFSAINTSGLSGNLTVNIIDASITETGAVALNVINNNGCVAGPYTILIKPNTGITTVLSGASATPLIDLNGAQLVTFDGSNNGSSSKNMTIRNTNTSGATIRFINDAANNTVKNTIVEGATTSTTNGTIFFSTSTGTLGNSSDLIQNCDIRDRSDAAGVPANGVYSSGTAAAPNASNTISGCNVFNWTNAGVLVSATGAGNGWTVNPSSFYQTAARTAAMTAISIQGGSGHSILNNIIGGSAPNAGGSFLNTSSTFRGIDLTVGTVSATSVQGNVVRNIRSTLAGSFTASYGIFLEAGLANIGNIAGNTVGDADPNLRFEISGDSYGYNITSSSNVNFSNNTLNNMTTAPGVPTGEYYFAMALGGTGSHTIVNNTIANFRNTSTPDGSFNTQNIGLLVQATGVQTVRGNTIHDISTTGGAGISANLVNRVWALIASGTAVGTVVEKNNIYNIYATSAGTGALADVITGLQSQAVANGTYSNNMVSVSDFSGSSDRAIFGILDLSAAPAVSNYYYNSSNVYGTATAANNSYAFNRNSTATVTVKNNIFNNTRSGGTGFHVAIANSNASATGWPATASNYNDLYSANPATVGQWLGSAAGNNRTFSAWQAAQAAGSGGDANSVSVSPIFNSATDLHLSTAAGANWCLNGSGIVIPTITTDIDGDTRSAGVAPYGPDMGADEFVATGFVVNNPAPVCAPGTVDLTAPAVTAGSVGGLTFTYFTDAAATIPLATPNAVAASGTYYIKASNGSCFMVLPVVVVINPLNTITRTSAAGTDAQTVCINTAIANITYATTNATGATFSGLPAGVNGVWVANVVTISGTPSVTGIFNYTVTLTGGCGVVTATGSITVSLNTITLTSAPGTNAQTVCINTPITNITYSTTGATGATFSGLPTGVNGVWAANVVTISGTPSVAGPFSYTITLTGGCGTVTANGTITVTAAPAATISYAGSPYCSSAGTATVTRTGTAGGTYSSTAGLSLNAANGDVTLGTSTPGIYTVTYTIAASGGCPVFTTTASITITAAPVATIAYTGSPYCTVGGTATVTRTGSAGGTFSSTAGLTINAANGDVTLGTSTPGTYTVTYTIAASGGCPIYTTTTSITVLNCLFPCVETFDGVTPPALPINWSATVGASCVNTARWATVNTSSSSAPNSAFVNDPNCISDEYLDSRLFTVGAISSVLTFRNSYDLENGFDGMVLEISINGGAFTDIITAGGSFVTGGYNGTISVNFNSPIAGRPAWTGNSGGFITTTVNLPAAALGQNVVFRWRRASDSSIGAVGANIDDVSVIATATISYAGSPYCQNAGTATVTRTGAAGGTYSSTAGLTLNAATGDVTLGTSTPGTYTVTYTIAASGGCPAFTTTTSITITAAPAATISYAGSPYCQNAGTANVTRTGTAGGTYSSTAGLTLNAATGAVTLGTSTPGTYTVTYTVAASGGCAAFSTSTTITITATPAATITYAGSPYCSTDLTAPVTRTGTAGGTYSSTAGLTINAATGTVTPNTSTPGTYTVTYTIAPSGGCGTFTTTTTITITLAPNAIIMYLGTPYCSNAGIATVSQFGTPGGTYSAAPAGLTINAATGAVTLATSTAGTYTVTYTIAASGGCGITITTTTITITPAPAATIAYTGSPYCSNAGTANVTRTGTAGGTYSSTAGLTINAATGAVTLGTSTPGTYTVTYTIAASGGCATFTTTTTITITALPAATIAYAGSPYCSNAGTATVTRTGTAGGTYTAAPAGLVINAATGDVNLATSTAGTYTVTYTLAAGGGCPAVTATTTITITTLPAATIVYAGNPYCQNAAGGTATVTRTGTAGGVYSAAPAGLVINAATGTVTLATSTPGTYTVSYTLAAGGGCGAVTATTTITINSLSTAPTAATASATTLCGPASVTLSVTGGSLGSGATWKWYTGGCGTGTSIGTGATLIVTASATTTYFVRAEGTCNTTTCASVTVTVNVQPTITIAASPTTTLTPFISTTLTATVTPADPTNTTVWYRNGIVVPGATGLTLVVNIDGLGLYTARTTTISGCTALSNAVEITGTFVNKMFITPNPNNGQFKVRYYTSAQQLGFLRHLVMFAENGQKVFDQTYPITAPYSSMNVDARRLPKGIYIVMLTDAFGKEVLATGKVVIQ